MYSERMTIQIWQWNNTKLEIFCNVIKQCQQILLLPGNSTRENSRISKEVKITFKWDIRQLSQKFLINNRKTAFGNKSATFFYGNKSVTMHIHIQIITGVPFQKFMLFHFAFYKKPTLVPVFTNQKNSNRDFCFYGKEQ